MPRERAYDRVLTFIVLAALFVGLLGMVYGCCYRSNICLDKRSIITVPDEDDSDTGQIYHPPTSTTCAALR